MGNPPFILSCREADWRGVAARIRISDDYGADPVLLHLRPFSWDDAGTFLANLFPDLDPGTVLEHLALRGLDGIYRNPLTLRLFGEVARGQGPLPDSRAELLERACAVMLIEDNPRHEDAPHARGNDEGLLLAAGAMCALQLLCDRTGIFTGATRSTPEGATHISEVERLPFGTVASDVLRTRLFQAEGELFFAPIHRVVAEYLGARWLAHCASEGCSEGRILGLFRPGDGVPTSLRGLHAWLAHFNQSLANRCIAADPYGVLRHGDAQGLSVGQARALLDALKNLSQDDPYFASGDWGYRSASGLVRLELKDDILDVLTAPDRNLHLAQLVLNAMAGTDLARQIAPELHDIVIDADRTYSERACAADALRGSDAVADWEAFVHQLLDLGDSDSARLACEVLSEVGANEVSDETAVDTVLSSLRITVQDVPRDDRIDSWQLPAELLHDFETARLVGLLDLLCARARLLLDSAEPPARAELGDFVRRLMVRVLEAGVPIAPDRLWTWIRWQDGHAGHDEHVRRQLAELLGDGSPLRPPLLEYVLLTLCPENSWLAAHEKFNEIGLGLFPTHDDVATLLRTASERTGGDPIDVDLCRDLFTLGSTHEGPAEPLRLAAAELADHDSVIREALASRAEVAVPAWVIKQRERIAREEAARLRNFERHRSYLESRQNEVADGNPRVLQRSADAYLGRLGHRLDREAAPHARLVEFLGEPLAGRVLEGFIAVLGRSDLPSAADIATVRADKKFYQAELPMFCGVAEMLRQGRPLAQLDRDTLAAVYATWRKWPGAGNQGQNDIAAALEAVLFSDAEGEEDHFRTSIEPQLAAGLEHVDELYRLVHDGTWASLAGSLSVEWLCRYPESSASC